MSAAPEAPKCKDKGCNAPTVTGRGSCSRHLKAANERMARMRAARKAEAQRAKQMANPTSENTPLQENASQTRPPLQDISINAGNGRPAKRKRSQDDSSSEEEESPTSVKVDGDLSLGGSHRVLTLSCRTGHLNKSTRTKSKCYKTYARNTSNQRGCWYLMAPTTYRKGRQTTFLSRRETQSTSQV